MLYRIKSVRPRGLRKLTKVERGRGSLWWGRRGEKLRIAKSDYKLKADFAYSARFFKFLIF